MNALQKFEKLFPTEPNEHNARMIHYGQIKKAWAVLREEAYLPVGRALERQTEKAVLIEGDGREWDRWLPKSAVVVENNRVTHARIWLVLEKSLYREKPRKHSFGAKWETDLDQYEAEELVIPPKTVAEIKNLFQ